MINQSALRPQTLAAVFALATFSLPPAASAQAVNLKDKFDAKPEIAKGAAAKPADERMLSDAIREFYSSREFKPLWFEGDAPAARTKALLAVLAKAGDHGLHPSTYGMPKLAERVAKANNAKAREEVEVELTLAYLGYAGDLMSGTVSNPRRVGGMFRDAKRPEPKKLLEGMAAASDAAKFLDNLQPDTRRYKALVAALAQYRELEKKGGWPRVDAGPTLKPGMKGPRVAQAKKRLVVTGDLAKADAEGDTYDAALEAGVKKFQLRHGLIDDGNIGAGTVAEMNVPVKDRIDQIVINIERRRWLAGYLGDRYIYVNIADNDLKIVEKDKTVYTARVVVGRPYHETPVFSGSLSYIEFNPWWNVPHGIATKEMLPTIRRVPGYLQSNDYLLLTRMGDNSSAIDPGSVNWAEYGPGNFPFQIRQKPGPKNALGTTLFMFPNSHNVFIHDTPSRSLFNLEDRYFSHGCVRVENPQKLAIFLLQGNDGQAFNEARIKNVIETREPMRVNLKNPLPVHITYLTAWAEADGSVQFRKDAYKRDNTLKVAMNNVAVGNR